MLSRDGAHLQILRFGGCNSANTVGNHPLRTCVVTVSIQCLRLGHMTNVISESWLGIFPAMAISTDILLMWNGTVSSILLLNTDLAVTPLSMASPGILACRSLIDLLTGDYLKNGKAIDNNNTIKKSQLVNVEQVIISITRVISQLTHRVCRFHLHEIQFHNQRVSICSMFHVPCSVSSTFSLYSSFCRTKTLAEILHQGRPQMKLQLFASFQPACVKGHSW